MAALINVCKQSEENTNVYHIFSHAGISICDKASNQAVFLNNNRFCMGNVHDLRWDVVIHYNCSQPWCRKRIITGLALHHLWLGFETYDQKTDRAKSGESRINWNQVRNFKFLKSSQQKWIKVWDGCKIINNITLQYISKSMYIYCRAVIIS